MRHIVNLVAYSKDKYYENECICIALHFCRFVTKQPQFVYMIAFESQTMKMNGENSFRNESWQGNYDAEILIFRIVEIPFDFIKLVVGSDVERNVDTGEKIKIKLCSFEIRRIFDFHFFFVSLWRYIVYGFLTKF